MDGRRRSRRRGRPVPGDRVRSVRGADSVLSLLLCDKSRGLFHRAILQSAALGVRDGRGAADVDQLLAAQTSATVAAQSFPTGWMAFAPIDGHAPVPTPDVAAQRLTDAAHDLEIVIGYTKHDAAPFAALAQSVGALDPDSEGVAQLTDGIFGAPARHLTDTWRTRGDRVLSYRSTGHPSVHPLGPHRGRSTRASQPNCAATGRVSSTTASRRGTARRSCSAD